MDQEAVIGIVKRFKKALEAADIRVEKLILFGSYAAGTAREDSDIDPEEWRAGDSLLVDYVSDGVLVS